MDVRDSAVVAVWWVGAGEHRAVLQLSSAQRVDLVDRLLERLPGAAAHEESMRVALGALVDAGRSVAVQARGFDQWFGLVRPFALGDIDGAEVILTAVVRAGALSFPLLTTDQAAVAAYEAAFDERAGRSLAWQHFTVECAAVEPAGGGRGGARAPQTALERAVIDSIERERAERGRMIALATGKNRVRLRD